MGGEGQKQLITHPCHLTTSDGGSDGGGGDGGKGGCCVHLKQ